MDSNCINIKLLSVTKVGEEPIIKLVSVARVCKHIWEPDYDE